MLHPNTAHPLFVKTCFQSSQLAYVVAFLQLQIQLRSQLECHDIHVCPIDIVFSLLCSYVASQSVMTSIHVCPIDIVFLLLRGYQLCSTSLATQQLHSLASTQEFLAPQVAKIEITNGFGSTVMTSMCVQQTLIDFSLLRGYQLCSTSLATQQLRSLASTQPPKQLKLKLPTDLAPQIQPMHMTWMHAHHVTSQHCTPP